IAVPALGQARAWSSISGDVRPYGFATEGGLDGHARGHVLIVALWQILEDPIEGLDQMAELLGARGRGLRAAPPSGPGPRWGPRGSATARRSAGCPGRARPGRPRWRSGAV